MKLNAIISSGQRVKDFIDIHYLLGIYSLSEMIGFYKKKYDPHNEVNVLKSLVYFEDIEPGDWPLIIDNPELTWEQVKQNLSNTVRNYITDN